MRTLLTGYSGFLGQVIFNHWQQENIPVECLGRDLNTNYSCDLTTSVPVFNSQFDLVVHAAGKAHMVPRSAMESKEFFDVNVRGTDNLLKGLQVSGLPKSFVFISSVAVYGLEKGNMIMETAGLNATDPYGKSKIIAENIIQNWCEKHGVICSIFRLPLIAGANPPGNLGAMIRGIEKGYYFDIGGGAAKKSVVLAEDVANIIPKALEIGGVYNLTDGYHPSFSELSKLIAMQLGKNSPPQIPYFLANMMAKVGDIFGRNAPINSERLRKITSNLTFDDSIARKALGWDPLPVLERFKIKATLENTRDMNV